MDWPALLALALLDSVNPSALVVTLILLARPGGARAVLPYVLGIYASYLAAGALLVSGIDLASEGLGDWLEHPVTYAIQTLIGLVLFTIAWRAPKEAPPRDHEKRIRASSLAALFVLGAAVTIAEIPTALPYLAATGILGTSDLAPTGIAVRLATYCAIFVAPPLLLTAGQVVLGERAGPRYATLRRKLERGAREALLWLFGIVGFSLAANGVLMLVLRLR